MKIAPCVATEQISKRDQAHCCLDILVSLSVSVGVEPVVAFTDENTC